MSTIERKHRGDWIRRNLLLFFCFCAFFSSCAAGANITTAGSGNWGTASTWVGGVVPGNGDTVVVNDFVTVTVTDARVIGKSGVSGVIAMNLNIAGAIVIASGGTLQVRGDTTYTAGLFNSAAAVTVQGGGIWEFDSSHAATPATTSYVFGPNGEYAMRPFTAPGGTGARATVRSNAGGGNGRFVLNGFSYGGPFTAAYADFLRIGDAANPGWYLGWPGTWAPVSQVRWDVQHSTFTNCGEISTSGNGVNTDGHFVHDYNVHSGSLSSDGIFSLYGNNSSPGAGITELAGNLFDIGFATNFAPGGFTIRNNYFNNGYNVTQYAQWATFTNNFVRSQGASLKADGNVTDSYIYFDVSEGNPAALVPNQFYSCNYNGIIWGQGGPAWGATATPASPGLHTAGVFAWDAGPDVAREYSLTNSILLPNARGYSSLGMGGLFAPTMQPVAEHNTWFGGYEPVQNAPFGNAAIQFSAFGNSTPLQLHSFRSNILFNPEVPGFEAAFWKTDDAGNHGGVNGNAGYGYNPGGGPTQDVCTPANCDFNTGWNNSVRNLANTTYTRQGRGYSGNWSATPGLHDIDTNPYFVDWQRTVELFDSKYLGNQPAAWSPQATYTAGAFVQHAVSTVYWGLPVNYRYTNGAGCQNANPEPGVSATTSDDWKNCWEWASLYRLRQAVASQQLYDDQVIGLHGEDMITAVIKWIRAGYAPQNSALMGAAHDGFDIGAVPVVFAPPQAGAAPQGLGSLTSGQLKTGIIQ